MFSYSFCAERVNEHDRLQEDPPVFARCRAGKTGHEIDLSMLLLSSHACLVIDDNDDNDDDDDDDNDDDDETTAFSQDLKCRRDRDSERLILFTNIKTKIRGGLRCHHMMYNQDTVVTDTFLTLMLYLTL